MQKYKILLYVFFLAVSVLITAKGAFAASFTFTSAGDYGTGSAASANYNLIKTINPDFHVATGDFAYGGSPSSWTNTVKSILGTNFPFEIVAGNHDAYNGASQWNTYVTGLPNKITLPDPPSSVCQYADPDPFSGGSPVCQQYGVQYYFDYPVSAPIARVINIAPGGNVFNWHYTASTNHYKWTSAAIDDARVRGIPWVFVTMHENCISSATKSCSFTSGIEADLMNLLISKKVDVVVQAHDHTYQRSKQLSCAVVNSYNSACVSGSGSTYTKGLGTTFVINGLGGVSRYTVNSGDSENGYFQAWNSSSYGIVKYTVSDNPMQLTAQYIPSSGTYTDTFSINAGDAPVPTPTLIPTPGPTATPTPVATPVSTPAPSASATPSPTVSPSASPVPSSSSSGLGGDANNDAKVDEQDYQVWFSYYLQNSSGGAGTGDFNTDGTVDGIDFAIWRKNYTIASPTPTLLPSATPVPSSTPGPTPSGVSYYVGCDSNASDSNSGKSPTSAWATLAKASTFTGQNLILERGCTWNNQRLTVSRTGSPGNNIYVDSLASYATGNGGLPVIQRNSSGPNISLSGSHITVQNVELKGIAPGTASCTYNSVSETIPVGNVNGIDIETGAFNNTVQNIVGSGFYAGIFIKRDSYGNKILSNDLHDNTMLASGLTSGAFGVLIWGHDNEIAGNTISGNDVCSPSYGRDGSAIEVYGGSGTIGASNNIIHHNFASNSDAFAELGKTSSSQAANNTFAYNEFLYNSVHNHGIFLVTRGSNDSYGPILGTKLYNNSVYITGTYKQAIVCFAGCNSTVLKMRNNIIQKAAAIYTDQAIDENYNLFVGTIRMGGSKGANSLQSTNTSYAGFSSIADNNFTLKGTSPAIDAGTTDNGGFTTDLSSPAHTVPLGSAVDMGAYEY